MWLLCMIPVSVILFVVILTSLRWWGLFDRGPTIVLALCTTLLCMLALFRMFVSPDDTQAMAPEGRGTGLDFLLIPYAALAVAILAGILFLFVRKLLDRYPTMDRASKALGHEERSLDSAIRDGNRRLRGSIQRLRRSDELAKFGRRTAMGNPETRLRRESTSRENER